MSRRPRVVMSTLALVLLAACGDDGTGPSGPATLLVSSTVSVLPVGSTTQLTAVVRDADGDILEGQTPTWSSDNGNVASVDASGLVTALAVGTARIEATVADVTGSHVMTVRAPDCEATAPGGSIDAGDDVAGVLDENDCFFPQGPHTDGYAFEITEETVVEVMMTSDDVDAVLLVTDRNMELVAVNDDAGFTTDSRLLALLEPGDYVLWATSFDGALGSYQLAFDTGTRELCSEPVATLGFGDSFDGELGTETCYSTLAGLADPYLLQTDETVTARITLSSEEFDAFLGITDADGTVLAVDDDGAGNFNALLVITLEPGSYTVWASSYVGVEYGTYELELVGSAAAVAGTGALDGLLRPAPSWPTRDGKGAGKR